MVLSSLVADAEISVCRAVFKMGKLQDSRACRLDYMLKDCLYYLKKKYDYETSD